MTIGQRLFEERTRLGLTQEAVASHARCDRKSVRNYESGARFPTAVQLEALAALGFDVQYVITGHRSAAARSPPPDAPHDPLSTGTNVGVMVLTAEERLLVENYRAAEPAGRRALSATGAALAQPRPKGELA